MKMTAWSSLASAITLLGTLLMAASHAPASLAASPKTTVAPAQPASPPSLMTESYPATLAEGIDFTKPGYPTFIAEVIGMSHTESWGRWTEGAKAVFRFKQPLPQKFTLVIKTNAFGPNIGEAIKVKIGAAQQTFNATQGEQTHHLSFTLSHPVDTVEFLIPRPASPQELRLSQDARKLGIGLISLKIE